MDAFSNNDFDRNKCLIGRGFQCHLRFTTPASKVLSLTAPGFPLLWSSRYLFHGFLVRNRI